MRLPDRSKVAIKPDDGPVRAISPALCATISPQRTCGRPRAGAPATRPASSRDQAPICPGCSSAQAGPVADLLRLNTGIPPTAAALRKRLGFIAGDSAGYPNGRRVSDDVTDISIRAVVGLLAGPPYNGFPNNRLGDGVNTNDKAYQPTFPYVGFAQSGRNSRHVDPGEPGCAAPTGGFPAANCPQ